MKWLDLTLPTPAENLACDEALLDLCEERPEDEILRFWEPQTLFVVIGYANRVSTEVNAKACESNHLPVLRRCSGGGAVLQGPGCLNYALILKIEEGGPLRTLASANRFIMERNRAALDELLGGGSRRPQADPRRSSKPNSQSPRANSNWPLANRQSPIEVQGHTDLTVDGLKVSGNAQRRKKRVLLFHGTFLLRCDFASMEKFLPLPSKQPDYRRNRAHQEFLTTLAVTPDSLKRVLRQAWRALEPFDHEKLPREAITALARQKYETSGWNLKFK
jgi:lipoate-protein ligase A